MNRKDQIKRSVVSYRQRMKLKLIAYKGGKCIKCGYDKPIPSAYALHHRDPNEKDFSIGGKSLKWETLKKEADKCDLVCQNCHAEIHDHVFVELRQQNIDIFENYQKSFLGSISCKQCGVEFTPWSRKRKYCSEDCSQKSQRKCERPKKEELEKMISEMSWVEIGRKYNVSDNTIRKWAKKYIII